MRIFAPLSISSTDIVRGGHIRILFGPDAPVRRPLCPAKDATLLGVTWADVSRIAAQNKPAPIYPATCGGFAVFNVDMSNSPMRLAFSDKSSSTSTSRAANADEHAIGVAAMVDPILFRLSIECRRLGDYIRTHKDPTDPSWACLPSLLKGGTCLNQLEKLLKPSRSMLYLPPKLSRPPPDQDGHPLYGVRGSHQPFQGRTVPHQQ